MTESESAALPFGYSPMLICNRITLGYESKLYCIILEKASTFFLFPQILLFLLLFLLLCLFCFYFLANCKCHFRTLRGPEVNFSLQQISFFLLADFSGGFFGQFFPADYSGFFPGDFSGGFFPADFFVCVFKKREPAGICPGRWFSRPRQEPAQLTVQLFLFASAKQVVDEQEHGIELQSSGKHVEHEDKL